MKLSRLCDLKGKRATDSRCFSQDSVAKCDVIIAHCIFWQWVGLVVMASEVIFTADTLVTKNTFPFHKIRGRISEKQIHPNRIGAVSHTPMDEG